MKKIITVVLMVAMLLTIGLLSTACTKGDYVAIAVEGAEQENFGVAIKKGHAKTELVLTAANKVIKTLKDSGDMDKLIKYNFDLAGMLDVACPVTMPDLSKNGETLHVYLEGGFAPYEFYKNGKEIVGLDINLATLIAGELNMKLEIHDVSFSSIITSIKENTTSELRIAIAGITISEERKEEVSFSDPYCSSVQYIISTKANSFKNLAQLAGKKVGVQDGTTGSMMVADDAAITLMSFKNAPIAFLDLKNGKIDAVIIDQLVAEGIVAASK